jgi:Flp pilus assembly protein TadG
MARGRKGNSLIEFVLFGIPTIFMSLSVFEGSLTMWEYHTLTEAAAIGARYVVTHGSDCSQGGNSCTRTGSQVAGVIQSAAVGLDPTKVNVTLTPQTGTVIGPYVLSDCVAGNVHATNCTANFPNGLAPPSTITVTLTYTVHNPIVMLWPGARGVTNTGATLGAVSSQEVVF